MVGYTFSAKYLYVNVKNNQRFKVLCISSNRCSYNGIKMINENKIECVEGATGLYNLVGGAGADFCIVLNMLHISDLF